MKFKVGDIIVFIDGKLKRKITKVFRNHYEWCYPDMPDKIFDSRSSNDILLEYWKLKEQK